MIAKVTAALTLIGSIAGGIYAADARYVLTSDYQDFQWSIMKEQLRELRKELRSWDDTTGTVPHELERDYEELLDLFCRKYPQDRECR